MLPRVTRSAYVDAERRRSGTPGSAHRLDVFAVLRSRPGVLAASHQSAATLHRLPVLSVDLGRVHVVRRLPARVARRHDAFTVHRCRWPDTLDPHAALTSVTPAVAVLGTAVAAGVRSGIVAPDAALRAGLTTRDELEAWLDRMRHTPGLAAARHVVAHACASAESAGESLCRLVLLELGDRVVPQFRVVTADGRVVARVDFLLPDLGVVVEFDGAARYQGAAGRAALVAEKRREDDLRSLGYGVARLTWPDLFSPARVEQAVRRAAGAARVSA